MADLQQALVGLKDIRLPESISIWQVAPGWWLSALLGLLVLIISYRLIVKFIQANRYRRNAIKQLNNLCQQQEKCLQQENALNDFQLVSEINQLLKSVAIKAYPTHGCSALSGKQWQGFLAKTIAHQKQATPQAFNVFELMYQANPSIDEQQRALLIFNARLWLRKHKPLSSSHSDADPVVQKESSNV